RGLAVGQSPAAKGRIVLRGAGATFPAPLYEKWIQTYCREHPEVAITYEAVGSGEGQRRVLAAPAGLRGSAAALSDEQLAEVKVGARLLPATAGMVVLAYNLPGLNGLKIRRDVYVDIFTGRIHTWDDPRIRADNPGLKLPNRSIQLVARQD